MDDGMSSVPGEEEEEQQASSSVLRENNKVEIFHSWYLATK